MYKILWKKKYKKYYQLIKTKYLKQPILNLNDLSNIEKGIHISRKHLQELRIVLRSETFENKADEINKTAYKKIMKEFDTYAKGVVGI